MPSFLFERFHPFAQPFIFFLQARNPDTEYRPDFSQRLNRRQRNTVRIDRCNVPLIRVCGNAPGNALAVNILHACFRLLGLPGFMRNVRQ